MHPPFRASGRSQRLPLSFARRSLVLLGLGLHASAAWAGNQTAPAAGVGVPRIGEGVARRATDALDFVVDPECAAPIDPGPARVRRVAGRTATESGATLTFDDARPRSKLVLGVLGPTNEASPANLDALGRYLRFFREEHVDAVLLPGDIGESSSDIARVLREVASLGVPVLALIGNRECRADFSDGLSAAAATTDAVVNMNRVRVVEFPELTILSLPGYHAPEYITCATGCRYSRGTVAELLRVASDAARPTLLLSHGPPRGEGTLALDFAGDMGNVGDPAVTDLIERALIPFGVFSNIKEAGGRAVADSRGRELLREGHRSRTLFLNPGPADTVGWMMNDGTKSVGMAATMAIQNGVASFKVFRLKEKKAGARLTARSSTNGAAQPPCSRATSGRGGSCRDEPSAPGK